MNRIRQLREAQGKPQKALAFDLGVSQATISDWESGRKVPSAKSTIRLAQYFEVSVEYLLGVADENDPPLTKVSTVFGSRLKKIRESRGYKSQQAFADDFGVAQSTVGGWESGSREPPFDTLIRLADFFGVTVDWLLGLVNEESPLAEISEEALDAEIVAHLKALSPEDLKTVDYAVQGILAAREGQASPPAGGHKLPS